jgi:hypothetical protein
LKKVIRYRVVMEILKELLQGVAKKKEPHEKGGFLKKRKETCARTV